MKGDPDGCGRATRASGVGTNQLVAVADQVLVGLFLRSRKTELVKDLVPFGDVLWRGEDGQKAFRSDARGDEERTLSMVEPPMETETSSSKTWPKKSTYLKTWVLSWAAKAGRSNSTQVAEARSPFLEMTKTDLRPKSLALLGRSCQTGKVRSRGRRTSF